MSSSGPVPGRWLAALLFFGVLFLGTTAIIVGDVLLYNAYGPEGTISAMMHDFPPIDVAAFSFFLGGTIGFLAGHFWWGFGSKQRGDP